MNRKKLIKYLPVFCTKTLVSGILFLGFPAGKHPFYQRVYLRRMPVAGGEVKVIAYLYGGQGTINVPSWSPDSKKIAFVSNGIFN